MTPDTSLAAIIVALAVTLAVLGAVLLATAPIGEVVASRYPQQGMEVGR